MPAVASSSTLADAQKPRITGPPRRSAPPSAHRARRPTPIRRHPDKAVPVHPASPAATDRARGDASPTQPVPGDERNPAPEPAVTNEDHVSIGRGMPAAPASLPGWKGLPERVDVLGVLTQPSSTRPAQGQQIAHPRTWPRLAIGGMALEHTGRCRKGAALRAPFLAPAMLARMRRDAPRRLDFP